MVFDLEVETTYIPCNQFIICSEVGSGLQLVKGPFVFNFICRHYCLRESSFLYSVCQLEHDTQYQATGAGIKQEAYQPWGKANHVYRQRNIYADIKQLKTPEENMIEGAELFYRHSTYLTCEVLAIVGKENPEEIK